MSNRGLLVGSAALLVVGLIVLRTPGAERQDPASAAQQRTEQAVEHSFAALAEASPSWGNAAAPNREFPSPAHAFRLSANGGLVVDDGTSTLLDVLLTELPRHAGRAQIGKIEKDIAAGLPQEASRQLARLLRAYVAYRDAETDLGERQRGDASLTPEMALDQLHELRIAYFGETLASAMYLKEEKRMRADLAATRPGAAGVAVADAPDRGVAADPVVARLRDDVSALRSAGAPETQVAALREKVLGPDRAQQLQDMDAVQADWEQRSRAFLAAVRPGTASEEMEGVLRGLYSEQEIPAARAYNLERLHNQQQGNGR